MTSGELLKKIRKEQNLSLRAVSLLAGVSHTQISDLENNVNFGTVEKIEKILNSLQMTDELKEQYYTLRDLERTPESIKQELIKLKKEIEKLKSNTIIQNNHNNGDVVIGKNEKYYYNSTNDELDLSGLDEKDIEDVKKYIEFLKSKK